jgi:type I restriction enzyme M protein
MSKTTKKNGNGTSEPLEKQLWKTADKLRKNIDAAEYKHVVLGLIFLKYISDAFEELYARLNAEQALGADPEDKDEYKAENVFLYHPKPAGPFCYQRPSR